MDGTEMVEHSVLTKDTSCDIKRGEVHDPICDNDTQPVRPSPAAQDEHNDDDDAKATRLASTRHGDAPPGMLASVSENIPPEARVAASSHAEQAPRPETPPITLQVATTEEQSVWSQASCRATDEECNESCETERSGRCETTDKPNSFHRDDPVVGDAACEGVSISTTSSYKYCPPLEGDLTVPTSPREYEDMAPEEEEEGNQLENEGTGDNGAEEDCHHCPICLSTFLPLLLSSSAPSTSTTNAPHRVPAVACKSEPVASGKSSPRQLSQEGHHEEARNPRLIPSRDVATEELVDLYRLEACQHILCRPCLHEYCSSRVKDGKVDIRCCFPVPDSKDRGERPRDDEGEELSLTSGVLNVFGISSDCRLKGADDMAIDGEGEEVTTAVSSSPTTKPAVGGQTSCEAAFTKGDIRHLLCKQCPNDASGRKASEEGGIPPLVKRYERFIFDDAHGDKCRRCPKCDTPKLFDLVHATDANVASRSMPTKPTSHGGKMSPGRKRRREGQDYADSVSKRSEALSQLDDASGGPKPDTGVANERGHHHNMPQERGNIVPSQSIVHCERCSTEFCYFHSNAHVGKSCEEYEAIRSQSDVQSAEYLAKSSKPCPSCGVAVQKTGGCNQMTCVSCDTHFCWICLAIVDGGTFPAHFQWWNMQGCPNMQLHEGENPSRLSVYLRRGLSLVQLFVLGIPAVVLAVASSIVCCCCVPAFGRDNRERARNCVFLWGSILSALVLFPLILIASLFSCLLSCALGICGGILPTARSRAERFGLATELHGDGDGGVVEDGKIDRGTVVGSDADVELGLSGGEWGDLTP